MDEFVGLAITPCPVGGVVVPLDQGEVLAPLIGLGAAVGVAIAAIKKRAA